MRRNLRVVRCYFSQGGGQVLASARVEFRTADEQLGVHLSLTGVGPSAMRVTWTSNSSSGKAVVQFGTAASELHSQAVADSSSFSGDDLVCVLRRVDVELHARPIWLGTPYATRARIMKLRVRWVGGTV
jgi:hypothetical protein